MAAPLNINANLNLNPASINASAKQVQQALGRITGQASEFQKSLDASTARVFAFGATTAVINGVTQSFKALISTTITVQSKLVEINSILGAGAQEFNKYRNSIFQVAKVTGQSFETVAEGAAELARQGLSATESAKRLQASLILTRISGLGAEQSVKALTAAMNGFTSAGLSAEQVVNKIVAVDTAFAVSAQDLAEGFSRAGSTAEDAGVSFDQLLGLITAVEQRTARGGAVIGNAFKSIFTRLSRGTTIEDLKSLGVEINATQTGVQKLQALSKALENISDPTVASQIKELAGGVFQINVVSAALKDIGSDASVFGQATAKSFNATNEATSKNIALNEQLSAQINSLVVSVTSLGAKLGGITFGPLLKNLVGLATKFSEMLDGALDPEKGNKFIQSMFKIIGGFISGPGLAIFTVAFAKIFGTVFKFAKEGFKTVMQMGSATERIKSIESGIVGLLQKDDTLRKAITNSTASLAQKEQAVIQAIQRENQLLQQQEDLVKSIARQAANKGVRGFDSSRGFTGKRGRRYASGGAGEMEPNLMTAMMNEARDAPRGATPFVTNFRGQPAVMNTSEMQVRINGREEILREDQIPRFNRGSKLNKDQRAGMKHRQGALNRDGRFIMLHGAQTGYKLNKFYMGTSAKDPSKAGKPTLSPTENNKTLINVPSYGIPKDKKGIGDINDIIKKLGDTSIEEALRIARDLSGGKMPDSNKSKLKTEISSQINNGTHKAFAGNIQELALGSLLTDTAYDDYIEQGTGSTFDLNLEGQARLKKLYRVRGHVAKTGEVKASGGNKLAGDTARKIFRVSKMNEAIHSTKGGNKAINPKGFKGVTIPLKRGGTQTIKTMKGLTSAIYGQGTQHAGKKVTQAHIDGLTSGRIRPKTKSKGSLPNLKIKRYNEGSMGGMMGGMDPMMLLMMAGGFGGSLEKDKNTILQRKKDKKRMRQIKARIDRANPVKRRDNTPKTSNEILRQIKGQSIRQPSSRASRLTSRMSAGFKNTLGNKTPSIRGGMGLSVAGQAIGSLAPGAGGLVSDLTGSQTAGDTTEAFGSATGSITQFAAAGAMVAGPLGAATGAVIGFGKALMDVGEMNKSSAKIEREAQGVSTQYVSNQLFKEHTGGQQVFDNPDTMAGRFKDGTGMTTPEVEAKLSSLAKGTGMESLNIMQQLMESKKAFESFSMADINSKEAKEAQKVYVQNLKHATKLIKNSNAIGSAINKIKEKQKIIEEELANDLSDKLSKNVDVIQDKLDTKQGLMVGRQGPFADIINRDLGLAQKSGEVTQAMSVVGKLKNQLAGAETEGQREEINALLKEATADFTDKIKEGAIFMQQKQNEVGREILAVEKSRQDLISKRNEGRGAVNLSDLTKAGTGEIFDLSIVGRFQEELKNIRSSGISGDEKDVRISELVAEVGEAISGLNEGRQKFIKSITVQTLADSERESAAKKRAIGGEEKNFEGISLKQRFMESGFDESAFDTALEENANQLQALKTQQDTIAKQMKNYADAFDAKSIVESVAKTNKELEKATENLAKYTEASEKIGGLSGKILTLADTAGRAIEEQNKFIAKLVKSSKASETSVGALVSKETGKNEKT